MCVVINAKLIINAGCVTVTVTVYETDKRKNERIHHHHQQYILRKYVSNILVVSIDNINILKVPPNVHN